MKIYISGEIGFETTATDIANTLERLQEKEPIEIVISSVGGSVVEGFAIYQMLRNAQAEGHPVSITGMGIVGSIATIIFLAAEKENRRLVEGTQFFVHAPSTYVSGNSKDLEAAASQIKQLEEIMQKVYLERTTVPENVLAEWLAGEKLLTEAELVQYGFVSEIEKLNVAAKINTKINFNMDLKRIKALLGIENATAKVVLDATGTEIEFPELDENAEPKVGDKALIGGQPANGEYVLPDGTKFVFVDGTLTEIVKPDDTGNGGNGNDDDQGSDVEELKAMLRELVARVEALTKANAKLKAELLAVSTEYNEFLASVKAKMPSFVDNVKIPDGGKQRKLQLLK